MERTLATGSPGYSTSYVENAFLVWYANGQPSAGKLILLLDADDQGHRPGRETVVSWVKEGGWLERAAELDRRASEQYEAEYVAHKALMMARHARVGKQLVDKGWDWVEKNPIRSAHAALRAIELGIEIEKDASNLSALLDTVTKMGDEKLMSKLDYLLAKANIRNNIDGDSEVEETEIED